jgi:hypothetical protein
VSRLTLTTATRVFACIGRSAFHVPPRSHCFGRRRRPLWPLIALQMSLHMRLTSLVSTGWLKSKVRWLHSNTHITFLRFPTRRPIETDKVVSFNPNFTLSNMADGFRIFAFEESLDEVPTRRSKVPGSDPEILTVFLHTHRQYSGVPWITTLIFRL